MSDGSALSEIKAAHPGRLLIPLAKAAPFIAKTPSAAAKLAQRGAYESFASKRGGLWMANVKKLAEFIDGPGEEPARPTTYAPPVRIPKGRAPQNDTEKTVRPPSMAKALLAMRNRIESSRAQLEFEQLVFAQMEAIEIGKVAKPGAKRRRPERF